MEERGREAVSDNINVYTAAAAAKAEFKFKQKKAGRQAVLSVLALALHIVKKGKEPRR